MTAPAARMIIAVISALFAGCGDGSVQPPPNLATTTTAAATQNVLPGPATRYKHDAYGPMQWSPFTGVNSENIYRATTGPTTGPVDDSLLIPTDDETW